MSSHVSKIVYMAINYITLLTLMCNSHFCNMYEHCIPEPILSMGKAGFRIYCYQIITQFHNLPNNVTM